MIDAAGLHDWFPKSLQILGHECDNPKPHPEPYLRGLALLGAAAARSLAFEDSLAGARSAIAAKIPTVGVCTTQDPEELVSSSSPGEREKVGEGPVDRQLTNHSYPAA